jgi:hypothetical protein
VGGKNKWSLLTSKEKIFLMENKGMWGKPQSQQRPSKGTFDMRKEKMCED